MSVKWENSLSVNLNSSDFFMKVAWKGWVAVTTPGKNSVIGRLGAEKKFQIGS